MHRSRGANLWSMFRKQQSALSETQQREQGDGNEAERVVGDRLQDACEPSMSGGAPPHSLDRGES